jgi:hypothetical protein
LVFSHNAPKIRISGRQCQEEVNSPKKESVIVMLNSNAIAAEYRIH